MSSSASQRSGDYSEELACDYDTSMSGLYALLEASNWGMAVTRTQTHPVDAKTWVFRRDKVTKETKWRLLPLHAAIIFQAPLSVIEAILTKYPVAVMRADDQGMLPLHLAFRHKQVDEGLLQLLLMQHPKAVKVKDYRGRTPLEFGRDGVYSAKLLQVYADTCVAVSDGEASANSISLADLERRIHLVREEFESQLLKLGAAHENDVERITQEHMKQLEEMQESAKTEKETLEQMHKEEMQAIHDVVFASSDEQANSQERNELIAKVEELRSFVKETKAEVEMLKASLKKERNYNQSIEGHISKITQDQVRLGTLVTRQYEELEAAQGMRTQLLKTLLAQEQEDAPNLTTSSKEIEALCKSIQQALEEVVKSSEDNEAEAYIEAKPDNDEVSEITDEHNF
jgi:hypothetical protein